MHVTKRPKGQEGIIQADIYAGKNTALLAIWPDGMASDCVSRCCVWAARSEKNSGALIGQMERGI